MFLLLLALLLYWDNQNIVWRALLACALHESGHFMAITACRGRVNKLRISAVGAEMLMDPAHGLSYGKELLCTLAGPGMNLLLAAGGAQAGMPVWAGLNLVLGCFHLLPVFPMDGGRALYLLLCLAAEEEQAARWTKTISCVLASLLLAGGAALWVHTGGNFTLLLVGGWIFGIFGKQKDLSTLV